MYLDDVPFGQLASWIRQEITFPGHIAKGTRGIKARRVQEWLNLHGIGLDVDADFGPITASCVSRFQSQNGMKATGSVNARTFAALVKPMTEVLAPLPSAAGFTDGMVRFAEQHLSRHPREVGGQNRGPWVRLYMRGHEGESWPWCAGFTTFMMEQSAELANGAPPIDGSFSCDSLAAQAKAAGIFLSERDAQGVAPAAGSLFLVRRTSTDWTHVGVVSGSDGVGFETIEGNTNDDGHREGYEVCARTRGFRNQDFIVF